MADSKDRLTQDSPGPHPLKPKPTPTPGRKRLTAKSPLLAVGNLPIKFIHWDLDVGLHLGNGAVQVLFYL